MIAIVGAGIQGCAVALELASRGIRVELFDKSPLPLQHASRWNEGKIHLGYIFAKDKSLASAGRMALGAKTFFDFFERHLGGSLPLEWYSDRFVYAVHRESMLSVAEIEAHLRSVDSLIASTSGSYFGERKLRPTSRSPDMAAFCAEKIVAAFETPERSINVHLLADRIAQAILSHPLITFHGGTRIESFTWEASGRYALNSSLGESLGPYEQLINCAWEGRLGLDASLGYTESRRWMHRYKLALHLKGVGSQVQVPSTTFVLAPLGDVVNFGAGKLYLSWYPVCKIGESFELVPPEPVLEPDALQRIGRQAFDELSHLIPALSDLSIDWSQAEVKGGHIFAWGEADIDHETSGLHARSDIGVFSDGKFHSIDTGKYGMAGYFALEVADRVEGNAR